MESREIWNNLSRGYAPKHGFGRGLMRSEKEMLGKFLSQNKIKTILDIACGPGRHVRSFKNLGLRPMGIDFSIGMLREAKNLGNEDYVLADAHILPFADNSFDCSVCLGNSMGSLEPEKAIKEMLRVSKKICISDFRHENGKQGNLSRRFDSSEYPIRVWTGSEVESMLKSMKLNFRLSRGQPLERGYFFYAMIYK
jgi:SAM-dependent methyltransferase